MTASGARGLPADGHVHSEWSWDTRRGSMERTCERAVELGLPAVAFTEHVDRTTWSAAPGTPLATFHGPLVAPDGTLTPPPLDVDGYLAAVGRCRDKFPGLRILTGVELGEPHWHADDVAGLLAAGRFERVLGSLHSLPIDGSFFEMPDVFRQRPAADVVRAYLAELDRLVAGSGVFAVLAHVDYPVRYWPAGAGPYDHRAFEDELRQVLRSLAATGRALEVNTRVPLHPDVVRWWRDGGGTAITFGSDAHEPVVLARGFADAVHLVEAAGFRAGRDPWQPWTL
jgi:histidinol-phosphatase (PHP family)